MLTPDNDKGFVVKIAYGGYNVHVPGKHKVLKDKLDSKWYTEGQIHGLPNEICEDARKAFIDGRWIRDTLTCWRGEGMRQKELENALRDYHWMKKEIARLGKELTTAGGKLSAQYGIEASLPKASGNGDKIGQEVINRERQWKTLDKLRAKVKYIDENADKIVDVREMTVLNCLLSGLSIVSISQHMGLSERKIYMLKDDVVRKMRSVQTN